jgi:hypothetical protein
MSMPLLEWLCLRKTFHKSDGNNITNVGTFNKCAWNSLKYLDLGTLLIYVQGATKKEKSILKD